MRLLVGAAIICMVAPQLVCALVDINTASLSELETLSGIGPSKAQAIIDYRTQNGSFASIDEIMRVSGVGTATYNNIKNDITVSGVSKSSQDTIQSTSTNTQTSTSTSQTTTHTEQTTPVSSYVAPPVPSVYANAGGDRTVIVGADTEFDALAYDKNDALITASVRFSWNFGDGITAEGESVLHHYSYPGRYAVVLNIAQERSAASDHIVVIAEPARLSFDAMPDGGVKITNLAGRDLDLSGWIVRAAHGVLPAYFQLPPHTIVLSDASMYIARATLGFSASSVAVLQYPNGVDVLAAGRTSGAAQVATSSAATAVDPAPSGAPAPARATHTVSTTAAVPEAAQVAEVPAPPSRSATSAALVAAAASAVDDTTWGWWGAAAALAAAAGFVVLLARRIGASEWEITEGSADAR